MSQGSNFVDYVKICCRSGKGGAGSAHLHRDINTSKGGPDGGDGGRGNGGGREGGSNGGDTREITENGNEYGADTLRLYEMFLGPLEQAKPWNPAGITGVFGFLKKLWRLYFDENGLIVTNNEPSKDNLKTLHKTIKKVGEDITNFSFNT
jgi:hypothetical protein